jgi:8-hydroxy-5-deazaflavin:NADPH oxidoreductase
MRVGVLGSGVVGQTLGRGFVELGHEVKLGSRTPEKGELAEWAKGRGRNASIGTFADTARHGELLVLCCLGEAANEVIDLAGPSHFDGKVVIDATNPLDFSRGMPPTIFVGLSDSLGERIQKKLPQSRVVKCFNIVPNSLMIRPELGGTTPTMMIAGNDDGAKSQVTEILREFGWTETVDIGGIDGARWLEALVPLWVRAAAKVGNFHCAFKLLK